MPWAGSGRPHPLGGELWHSLTAALEDAASDVLQIEPAAVGALVSSWIPYQEAKREVVLFDRTPGGSGIVRHLAREMESLLERALERLRGCTCQAACVNCLLSYQRERISEKLNRHIAIGYLECLVSKIYEAKEGNPLMANPVRMADSDTWLQNEITRDGISGHRRRRVLLAVQAFDYDMATSAPRSWASILLDVAPFLTLSVPSSLLEGDDLTTRARRVFLSLLAEKGAHVLARKSHVPEWACILDPQSQDSARAIRFERTDSEGGSRKVFPRAIATTTAPDVVAELANMWQADQGVPAELSLLAASATSKDRLIEVPSGRSRTVRDVFNPVLQNRKAKTMLIDHTHLDNTLAMRRLREFVSLVAGPDSPPEVHIRTSQPSGLDAPKELQSTLRESLKCCGVRSVTVKFEAKRLIHDRRIHLTWVDGSSTEILIGRGLDFLGEREVLPTYMVIRE
jgi:hypothetical protein